MGGAQSCDSTILRVAAALADTSEEVHPHVRIRTGSEDMGPACVQSEHGLTQGNASCPSFASRHRRRLRDIHGGGVDKSIHEDQAGELYGEFRCALDFILLVGIDLALLHLLLL